MTCGHCWIEIGSILYRFWERENALINFFSPTHFTQQDPCLGWLKVDIMQGQNTATFNSLEYSKSSARYSLSFTALLCLFFWAGKHISTQNTGWDPFPNLFRKDSFRTSQTYLGEKRQKLGVCFDSRMIRLPLYPFNFKSCHKLKKGADTLVLIDSTMGNPVLKNQRGVTWHYKSQLTC